MSHTEKLFSALNLRVCLFCGETCVTAQPMCSGTFVPPTSGLQHLVSCRLREIAMHLSAGSIWGPKFRKFISSSQSFVSALQICSVFVYSEGTTYILLNAAGLLRQSLRSDIERH